MGDVVPSSHSVSRMKPTMQYRRVIPHSDSHKPEGQPTIPPARVDEIRGINVPATVVVVVHVGVSVETENRREEKPSNYCHEVLVVSGAAPADTAAAAVRDVDPTPGPKTDLNPVVGPGEPATHGYHEVVVRCCFGIPIRIVVDTVVPP